MLGILSGECKPVDKSLCVRPFVLVRCLGVDLASGFQGGCLALHTECFMGSAYSVGDLSRWTLRFYVAHGSLPTENRSVHPEMLRAIDAPNTMSHHSDLGPRCTAILQI